MTRDEIIRMAREAGLHSAVLLHLYDGKEAALTDSEHDELRRIERFAAFIEQRAAAAEREACINKIQAEINHALLNNHRLELKFGQARGDRAVRMSALEASLDWLRDRGEKP